MTAKLNEVDPNAPHHKPPYLWMGLMLVVLVGLTTRSMWGEEKISLKASPTIPELSQAAQHGRVVINEKCQECHGVDGTGGTRTGPPILHSMYREEVFPDFQFKRSVLEGKREKNWRFGPMPPVKGLSDTDLTDIIAFVREVQKASGIY